MIAEDQLDDAAQQIEFLTEVQQNLNMNAVKKIEYKLIK